MLTGGRSTRMGEHKPALVVGGRTLLDAALDAARDRPTIVVGDPRGVPDGVRIAADASPDGGPVVGIATGCDRLDADADFAAVDTVFVVASDQPFITSEALDELERARRSAGADVAVFVDGTGGRQLLCAAWSRTALARALGSVRDPRGAAVRGLFRDVRIREVPDVTGAAFDVDTAEELRLARERADQI